MFPKVAKLSRTLQTENLDLSMISSLLDGTLHSIDDAVLSSSNWILKRLEAAQDLKNSNRRTNNSRRYIHFSRENRPVLHSSVEGQHYKPFYLLIRGEFLQHL